MKESYPLAWPDGWSRTRPQDQRTNAQWRLPLGTYRSMLVKELDRMGTLGLVVSSNIADLMSIRYSAGMEPRDPGVAVYFSRTPKEDYRWQDALEIRSPFPTLAEVEAAYRRLSAKYHPDNKSTGDTEMFLAMTKHCARAKAWIERRDGLTHDLVLACDQFKEVRLNLNAIRLTLAAIRQIERCGASSMLERAFKGFAAITAGSEERDEQSAAVAN
jgi:hypothetical protein